jgi:hypothetical protein
VIADAENESFADGLLTAIRGLSEVSERIAADDHRWATTVKRTTRSLESIAENNP